MAEWLTLPVVKRPARQVSIGCGTVTLDPELLVIGPRVWSLETVQLEDFGHIRDAVSLSKDRISKARAILAEVDVEDSLDLVGFGSLARREATAESDFDYLVLVDGIPRSYQSPRQLLDEASRIMKEWELSEGRSNEVKPPGASGIFGDVVGAFDLIENIGLQRDTNHTLTRRMLLLEESVSLFNKDFHHRAVVAALERYLDHSPNDAIPRFLLNDVLRYWRTITVDYQAKANDGANTNRMRYLKLIVPRKVQFASVVLGLILCGKGVLESTPESLYGYLQRPPVERLQYVSCNHELPESISQALRGVVGVLDHYLAKSSSRGWRQRVKDGAEDEFEAMKSQARVLQTHLSTIFFDWDEISTDARNKLVF